MPKEQIGPLLTRIKQMIEQKTSIDVGSNFGEYTNPGPAENIIYIPVHDGKGAITPQDIGTGEVNPGSLADIDYFKNKLFGCLRGNTKIRFSDGSSEEIKNIVANIQDFIGKSINTCTEEGVVEESKLVNALATKIATKLIRFTLEDGSVIEVTPEHYMMLEDGTYKQAKDLTEDDILMKI